MRFFITLALVFRCASAFALSYSSAERVNLNTVIHSIEAFHKENGSFPEDWSQLAKYFDRPIDEVLRETRPTKRYGFLKTHFQLSAPLKGQILLVTRRPSYETTLSQGIFGFQEGLKGPGRNVIYATDDNEVHASWVKEDYIQNTFNKSELPTPDSEPDPIWISRARAAMYYRRIIYVLLGIGALLLLVRLSRWTRPR